MNPEQKLKLEKWLKENDKSTIADFLHKNHADKKVLEQQIKDSPFTTEFQKTSLNEFNDIIKMVEDFLITLKDVNETPLTEEDKQKAVKIKKTQEALIKNSLEIQPTTYETHAQTIIEAADIHNFDGDLYFYDFCGSKKWIRETSSSRDKSELKKLILNILKLRTNQIEEVYKLINIKLATPEKFKIKSGEEHTSFFLNGLLTPKGFITRSKAFQLFTLDFNYRKINPNSPKYRRLSEVLDIIFPQKSVRDYALALYYTCLIPHCYEIAVYNIGLGSNGKSWLMNLLLNIVGQYTGTFKPKKENQFLMADFKNKMFCLNQEGNKFLIEADLLKEATSDSPINYEKKGKDQELIQNYSTVVQNSNYDPKFSDSTRGVARRIKIIPFFTDDISQHPKAFSASESSQVLRDEEYQMCFINMMYDAFLKIYDDKTNAFNAPAVVEKKTKELLKKNTPVFAWLESEEFSPLLDITADGFIISKNDLFEKYRVYFAKENLNQTYLTKPQTFYEDLVNVFDGNYRNKYLIRSFSVKVFNEVAKRNIKVPHFEIVAYTPENYKRFQKEKELTERGDQIKSDDEKTKKQDIQAQEFKEQNEKQPSIEPIIETPIVDDEKVDEVIDFQKEVKND